MSDPAACSDGPRMRPAFACGVCEGSAGKRIPIKKRTRISASSEFVLRDACGSHAARQLHGTATAHTFFQYPRGALTFVGAFPGADASGRRDGLIVIIGVFIGVVAGVSAGVGTSVGSGISVGPGTSVGAGSSVGIGVAEDVAVGCGDLDGLGVLLGVGVGVALGVADGVDFGVADDVGFGDAVDSDSSSGSSVGSAERLSDLVITMYAFSVTDTVTATVSPFVRISTGTTPI